jgi:hypothetical protein
MYLCVRLTSPDVPAGKYLTVRSDDDTTDAGIGMGSQQPMPGDTNGVSHVEIVIA